jgi:hypothetical protein
MLLHTLYWMKGGLKKVGVWSDNTGTAAMRTR